MKEYIILQEGSNTFRILQKPTQIYLHYVYSHIGKLRVEVCDGESCYFCHGALKKYLRYEVPILDHNRCKYWMFNQEMYLSISNFFTAIWDEIHEYEVSVYRYPDGYPTRYNFLLKDKKELTKDQIKLIKDYLNDDSEYIDVCPKCGGEGEQDRMACICKRCGNVIWGC